MSKINETSLIQYGENNEENNISLEEEINTNNSKVKTLIECPSKHDFHHILKYLLDENVIGQDPAKDIIVEQVIGQILSFRNRKGPLGCLMFAGPTGVGKTEIVKALAKALLGNENAYTRISCENFQESHSKRDLFGAPKSYVGYDDPTPLDYDNIVMHYDTAKETGKIHDMIRPLNDFSIILFDEIEKAHPEVRQSLLTLMDEARVEFSNGKIARYENCLIIFTSNIGEHEISLNKGKQSIGFNQNNNEQDKGEIRNEKIKNEFSPEFLSRITKIVEFEQLSKEDTLNIINIHLKMLNIQLSTYYPHCDISISFTESCYNHILEKGYSKEKGARELIRSIDSIIENRLNILLHSQDFSIYLEKDTPVTINIDFDGNDIKFYIEFYEEENIAKEGNNLIINDKNYINKHYDVFAGFNEIEGDVSPLKRINIIFTELSQYIELYHVNLEGDIDFRSDIKELENKLKSYGFTQNDIICLRNRAYIEDIEELLFIKTFEGINVFDSEKKHIFHPYKQRIIMKIVEKKIKENIWTFHYNDFGIGLLKVISPIVQKLLKVDELKPIQIQELLIYIKKVISDKYQK